MDAGRKSLIEIDERGNFDPKVEAFFQCIKLGMSETAACDKADISRETVRRWRDQAKADLEEGNQKTNAVAFCCKYKRMRAECQQYLIQNILKAGSKSWQACAWMLQHRFIEDFGDNAYRNSENNTINKVEITYVDKDSDNDRLNKLTKEVEENIDGK